MGLPSYLGIVGLRQHSHWSLRLVLIVLCCGYLRYNFDHASLRLLISQGSLLSLLTSLLASVSSACIHLIEERSEIRYNDYMACEDDDGMLMIAIHDIIFK